MGFIYRITNPKGEIYIGETKDYHQRWKSYLTLNCEGQPKIYKSLKSYGPENHKFEVIEKCKSVDRWRREKYWIDFHNSYHNGLNACDGINQDYTPPSVLARKIKERLPKIKRYTIDSWSQRILWNELSKFMHLHAMYIIKSRLWHLQKDKEEELQEHQTKLQQQLKRFMRASLRTTQIEYRPL